MPPLQVTYDTITEHGCVQYALARIGTFTIGWYADRYACDDETSALHIRYGAATGAAGEFEPRGGWPDPPRIFRQQLYGASVVDVHAVLAHHPGSTASWIRVRRRTDHGISLALDGTTRRVADIVAQLGEQFLHRDDVDDLLTAQRPTHALARITAHRASLALARRRRAEIDERIAQEERGLAAQYAVLAASELTTVGGRHSLV